MEVCKQKLADSQRSEAAKGKKLSVVTRELNQVKARIKMAKEAEDKDFDRATWDVEEWKRLVADLGEEPVLEEDASKLVIEDEVEGTAKVAEEHGAVDAGKQVDQGDEGNDA
ncbi:hypothetical protein L1987_42362 [Smallanthus sonchifolius]|uniref:Uncharacterized protein n=1 Tax=Smallanthus sonchifolius TaxID=185202 RepID=A0ACB9GIK8_9ASTR|nr:hypothetical protein L1987_42362 [Smallanthus sonchifolius]